MRRKEVNDAQNAIVPYSQQVVTKIGTELGEADRFCPFEFSLLTKKVFRQANAG